MKIQFSTLIKTFCTNLFFLQTKIHTSTIVFSKKKNMNSLFFLNISEYKGQFEGGKRHGQGTLYHPDGSVFQGLFVFGQVNGKGILTLPNGDKISGEFRQVSFCFCFSDPEKKTNKDAKKRPVLELKLIVGLS